MSDLEVTPLPGQDVVVKAPAGTTLKANTNKRRDRTRVTNSGTYVEPQPETPPVIEPVPPPVIEPVYTPVPKSGLEAALLAARNAPGSTLYLDDGTPYPLAKTVYYGGTDVTVMSIPGKRATVAATGPTSTILYASSKSAPAAVRYRWAGIDFRGRDLLQDDGNGSSIVGFGAGYDGLAFADCGFFGSPVWTGNRQHLVYLFGVTGYLAGKNASLLRCTFDGRGQKATLISVYEPSPGATGLLVKGSHFRNAKDMGININDAKATSILLDANDFADCRIGIFHQRSGGTKVQNNKNLGGVGTLISDPSPRKPDGSSYLIDGGGNG